MDIQTYGGWLELCIRQHQQLKASNEAIDCSTITMRQTCVEEENNNDINRKKSNCVAEKTSLKPREVR